MKPERAQYVAKGLKSLGFVDIKFKNANYNGTKVIVTFNFPKL